MDTELAALEVKWSKSWQDRRAHEPSIDSARPKFFATYPYSYMNSYAHVGHAYTMMRVDVTVRYKRMKGYNTLFPFGFHLTGTPIWAAANRIREGEAKQIGILRMQGFSDEEIPKFADPMHWIGVFPKEWRRDVDRLGLAIDWRREFYTTDLNPHYDAFIRWQFRKLKEGGYVDKGKHPVIWCPKDNQPVADHDRYSGEGETPQQWVLYKMKLEEPTALGLLGDVYLIAATLRPDTVFGQTNVWVDRDYEYSVVGVGEEKWILSPKAARELGLQLPGLAPDPGGAPAVVGARLVGLRVRTAAMHSSVPVLPATFITDAKGTAIVTSVPSDSPQDHLSLKAIQEGHVKTTTEIRDLARGIKPIPVIRTERYETEAAVRAVAEAGARDHRDAAKIALATEKAYQAGFYEGVMLEVDGVPASREFAGKKVSDVKDDLTDWLVSRGEGVVGYWPSAPVVCRCLTPSVVKIVENQWFAKYGDAAWKARTKQAFDKMQLHPPEVRKQFEHVLEWLRAWACAREGGLGTRLPWDEKWVIESLSDSTIYMAYYTVAHLLERGSVTGEGAGRKGVDPKDLTDAFFDHVFLGGGTVETASKGTLTPELVGSCRREFAYWYPLDFRNSGKDLVQNHLAFMVFNHVAIWPDEPGRWPRAISVNGWVNVDGEKMSKSRGNFVTLRDALDRFGASATRLALVNAGEGLDDANFEMEFAGQSTGRLLSWLAFVKETPKTYGDRGFAEKWFESAMNRIVRDVGEAMEAVDFRTALKLALFDLSREYSWYLRRCGGRANADLLGRLKETQTRLLAPFVPHVAEEAWRHLGGAGSVIDAEYPTADAGAIDPASEAAEALVHRVLDDVREILKVTGKTPRRVEIVLAPAWKQRLVGIAARSVAETGRPDTGAIIKAALAIPDLKPHAVEIPKVAAQIAKELSVLGKAEIEARRSPQDEHAILTEARPFLATELGAVVEVVEAEKASPGAAMKARMALPGRPAIYVE